MTTNNEIVKAAQARKRARKLVPFNRWIHRDDMEKLDKHVKRMNKCRGIK